MVRDYRSKPTVDEKDPALLYVPKCTKTLGVMAVMVRSMYIHVYRCTCIRICGACRTSVINSSYDGVLSYLAMTMDTEGLRPTWTSQVPDAEAHVGLAIGLCRVIPSKGLSGFT